MAPEVALNLSRGCGNPTGFANLKPGNVVVDFGCGGGIDVILAARKVGKEGRVIGLDFATQMIERAKKAVIDSGLQQWEIELRVADMGRRNFQESALMLLYLTVSSTYVLTKTLSMKKLSGYLKTVVVSLFLISS